MTNYQNDTSGNDHIETPQEIATKMRKMYGEQAALKAALRIYKCAKANNLALSQKYIEVYRILIEEESK